MEITKGEGQISVFLSLQLCLHYYREKRVC